MAIPSTFGYAQPEEGVYIGYRVDGDGPIDIVWQPDWPGNIDMEWQDPLTGALLRSLASFGRVITHDHRGVGLSTRTVELPTLEMRVADLLAVLRSTGTRRPVLAGALSSGAVNVLLAATRPAFPRALVWLEPEPRYAWAPDFPWGTTDAERDLENEFLKLWGTDAYAKAWSEEQEAEGNPLAADYNAFMPIKGRNACTPEVAALLNDMWWDTDVRSVLGAVQTPTLLLVHEDRIEGAEEAEYVASQMPTAKLRMMPGLTWKVEEQAAWAEQIREFIGIEHPHPSFGAVLTTVLFTDIVGSTERAAAIGDREWRKIREEHDRLIRTELSRFYGKEIKTMGDGFLATFDGPARAVYCAQAIAEGCGTLGSRFELACTLARSSSTTTTYGAWLSRSVRVSELSRERLKSSPLRPSKTSSLGPVSSSRTRVSTS